MKTQNWQTKKIGDCCKLIKKQYVPNKEDNKNYIGLEHIEQETLKLNGLGNSSNAISNKFIFEKGQVLFGKLRPYFRKVFRPNFEGVCSTDIWVIDSKDGFDNNFLFYFFADQKIIDEATNSSEGTRMPRAKWDYLSELEFEFPPLPEQLAIAEILSKLDEKIELNNKTNATLEEIGQAIFKRWFIDNPEKENWECSTIGSELKTILGGTPDRMKAEYWNGSINWINSGRVNEFRITEPSERITEEGLKKSATSLLPKGTVVLAITGATLGQVSRLEINSCANQSVIGVLENENFSSEYLYYLIKNKIGEIIGFQTGGAQQHINKTNIDNFEIKVPDEKTLKDFNKIINPIFKQISINCFQNQTLSQIRDALLPKLMSGEIRVK